jgi:hypothetical protein
MQTAPPLPQQRLRNVSMRDCMFCMCFPCWPRRRRSSTQDQTTIKRVMCGNAWSIGPIKAESVVAMRVAQALQEDGCTPSVPYTFHQENGDPCSHHRRCRGARGFRSDRAGLSRTWASLRHRLGSVSDWVTDHAHCPVLLFEPYARTPQCGGIERRPSSPNDKCETCA